MKLQRFYVDPKSRKIVFGISPAVERDRNRNQNTVWKIHVCSICKRAFDKESELVVHCERANHYDMPAEDERTTSAVPEEPQIPLEGLNPAENGQVGEFSDEELVDQPEMNIRIGSHEIMNKPDENFEANNGVPRAENHKANRGVLVLRTEIPNAGDGTLVPRNRKIKVKEVRRSQSGTRSSKRVKVAIGRKISNSNKTHYVVHLSDTLKKTNMRRRHQNKIKRFRCKFCKKVLSREERLKLHILSYHAITSTKHKCGICEKYLKTKYILLKHEKSHQVAHPRGGTGSKCPISSCRKIIRKKCDLQRHIRTFHMKGSFSCKYCKKVLMTKYALEKHERLKVCAESTIHRIRDRKFLNSRCSERLKSIDPSSSRSATPRNRYKCPKCDSSYVWHHSLVRHLKNVHDFTQTEGQKNHRIQCSRQTGLEGIKPCVVVLERID